MEKSDKNILVVLVINCCLLCVGHAYSSFLVIAASLTLFLFILLASGYKMFLPVVLFHIPFVQLLRFNANSFSFFSLGIIMLFFWEICFRTTRLRYLPKKMIVPIAGICLYIVSIGLFRGMIPNVSLIMTLCQFVMVPLIAYHCKEHIRFRPCVFYLATGVILACVLSLIFQDYGTMKPFIEVAHADVADAARICGFTGDGNRMGAQTLAAMCAVIVLQLSDKGKNVIRYVVLLMLLLCCGMLTVSKMFLLEAVFLILLWSLAFFSQKGLFRKKIGLVICIVLVVCVVMSTGIVNTQIDIYIRRFSLATDASGLTTGRTDLWKIYLDYLLEKLDVLLVGRGWMAEYLYYWGEAKNMAPHNIFFEVVYRLGIVGAVFLIVWITVTCRSCVPDSSSKNPIPATIRIIVLVGFFGSWLAIPAIDFDEFFFFPLLAVHAIYGYEGNTYKNPVDYVCDDPKEDMSYEKKADPHCL